MGRPARKGGAFPAPPKKLRIGSGDLLPENIPQELKAEKQWLPWRPQIRKGKLTKVPVNYRTGHPTSVTDPRSLTDFVTAMAAMERLGVDGVGFVFVEGGRYVGFDFDNCRDPESGSIDGEVAELAHGLGYAEVSPSGTGIKVFVVGSSDLAGAKCGNFPSEGLDTEFYSTGRYFTVTGHVVSGLSGELVDQSERVQELIELIRPEPPKPQERASSTVIDLDDATLLDKARQARNGERFSALYDRGDLLGYPSQSEADLALASDLAFWTNGDLRRMDTLFRSSALMRSKWDKVHVRGRTYGAATLETAVSQTTAGYEPRPQVNSKPTEGEADDASLKEAETWGGIRLPANSELPEFPLEVFSTWCRSYLRELTRVLQTPTDFAGMLFFGVLAITWQKRWRLKVNSIWFEALVLWILLVAPSGSRKSPAFSNIFFPLVEWHKYMKEQFADVRKRAKRRRKELEARLDRLRKAKAPDSDLIAEIEQELDDLLEPPIPALFTGTATPEAIEEALERHHGRYAFASPESEILAVLMGEYQRGNAPPPIEALLSGHSGEQLKADYRSRKVDIDEAHFSQVNCTQPSNAAEIFNAKKLTGRGATGRFWTVQPRCEISEEWITEEIDPLLVEEYRKGVRAMLPTFEEQLAVYSDGGWKTQDLELSPGASALMGRFYSQVQRRRKRGDLQFLEEWSPKYCGQVGRAAALLHLSDYAFGEAPTEVSESALRRAIHLGDSYLVPHAKSAFGAATEYQLEKVWGVIWRLGKEIPRKDLLIAVKPMRSKELTRVLERLEEYNLIRTERRESTGGKPPTFILVNPSAPESLVTKVTKVTKSQNPDFMGLEADLADGNKVATKFPQSPPETKLGLSYDLVTKPETGNEDRNEGAGGLSGLSYLCYQENGTDALAKDEQSLSDLLGDLP